MSLQRDFVASMPQMDMFTLAEDWALAFAMESTWSIFAAQMGQPPSAWRDSGGERVYGAVMALSTACDLDDPVREDDPVEAETTLVSIRKPHAISQTVFRVGGREKLRTRQLTSFVRRDQPGQNKKFARIRDVWQAEDFAGERVDDWLQAHHAAKSAPWPKDSGLTHEVNALRDFHRARFMYFKTFVQIARAAEWRAMGAGGPMAVAERQALYYGNVEDGERLQMRIGIAGHAITVVLLDEDGRLTFRSQAQMRPVSG